MRSLRVVVGLAIGGLPAIAYVAACNGIIGVEDVTYRKDGGGEVGDDDGGDAAPAENVLEVALGLSHTCARKPDLSVKCWGDDRSGQTGTGGTADGGIVPLPQAVRVTDAIRLAAGKHHTCVVRTGGKINCWGDNQVGQLGNGPTNVRSPLPVEVKDITDAKALACGGAFTCAVREEGTVMCWGSGASGQLGNGERVVKPTPQPVSNLSGVVAISAGEAHACAVKDDGTVLCWGDGRAGQLGNNGLAERLTPTVVPALDGVATVAAGARSTCALKTTGSVHCWGDNAVGQLGTGTTTPSIAPSPVVVPNLDATALWVGSDHACAVKRDGTVACWGAGFQGQIGDGQARTDAGVPTPSPKGVLRVSQAVKVGTGGNHSCAASRSAIFCWGDNDRGQGGTGDAGGGLLSPEAVVGYP